MINPELVSRSLEGRYHGKLFLLILSTELAFIAPVASGTARRAKVPDLNCEVQDLLLEVVDLSKWWGAGVVICLERGADLHMAQLMPLPLTVSSFSKIQIGFTFLVPAHPGSPGQRAVKRVCVCACVRVCVDLNKRCRI